MKTTKQTIEFIVTFCLFLAAIHGFLFWVLGFATIPLSEGEKALFSPLATLTAWMCAVRLSLRLEDGE